MEFILEHRAESDTRQAKLEDALADLAARQAQGEARHESQMAAIRKLIQVGMKMLAKDKERLDRHDEMLDRLSAGQEELRAALKSFLDSSRN